MSADPEIEEKQEPAETGREQLVWIRSQLVAERVRQRMSLDHLARLIADELPPGGRGRAKRGRFAKQSLHAWETGLSEPGIPECGAWARALGMRLETVLAYADDEAVPVRLPPGIAEPARLLAVLPPDDQAHALWIIRRLSDL